MYSVTRTFASQLLFQVGELLRLIVEEHEFGDLRVSHCLRCLRLIMNGDSSGDIRLMSGDVVYVPSVEAEIAVLRSGGP